ncbi:MAG: 2-oxoglutarate translocator [Clostridioides sp.]|jgi:hypothetical protein|nr:2-oxoglutarate translocator [Clostridioides sp.]
MRNNKYRLIIALICISTGIATVLSIILPGWIFTTLAAVILIGCGVLLFLN